MPARAFRVFILRHLLDIAERAAAMRAALLGA